MGGQPFLAEPGVPLLSLEQLLLVPFSGQTAARLSIPLHVAVGWLGLYAFLLAIGLREREALLAGSIYLLNPSYMAFNAFTGHLNIIHGVAFVPWLLYVAVRPFRGAGPAQSGSPSSSAPWSTPERRKCFWSHACSVFRATSSMRDGSAAKGCALCRSRARQLAGCWPHRR